jgi:hypothetical protein
LFQRAIPDSPPMEKNKSLDCTNMLAKLNHWPSSEVNVNSYLLPGNRCIEYTACRNFTFGTQ